jgi:hypothetical protein
MLRMKMVLLAVLLACGAAAPAPAATETHQATKEEKAFYEAVVLPTLMIVKKAMPPAPQGWIVEAESLPAPALSEQVSGEPGGLQYSYSITYKRVEGVQEDAKQRDEAAAELRKKMSDAAKAEIEVLTKKQAETEDALKKARKRNEAGKEKKLQKTLDDIEKRLSIIPQETVQKIAQEADQYLVKDTKVNIRVFLNERAAEFPKAKGYSRPKAAFACRKEGEGVGLTGWKDTETIILYGNWSEVRRNVFQADFEQAPFTPTVRTVRLDIIGDAARVDQMLKKMSLKDIVEMVK